MRIILFWLIFSSLESSAQDYDLNDIIRIINSKYRNINYLSYDIVSHHQSLVSDTIDFSYTTHNILFGNQNSNALRSFYTTNRDNRPLFGLFDNTLYKFEPDDKIVHSWPVEEAKNIIKRGDFRWATFSPFIYSNPIIDSNKWNSKLLQQSILIIEDTVLINMERFYRIDDKFHSDDPDTGSTKIVFKASLKDSLIYYYQEILNISRKPQITTYFFSDYKFLINSDSLNYLKQKFENASSQDPVISHKKDTAWLSLRPPLTNIFNDTFEMFDLDGNSFYLKQFQERYIVMDFWFCGCPPCIKVSKILTGIHNNKISNQIKIIGINYIDKHISDIMQCSENTSYSQYFVKHRDEIKFLDIYGAPLIIIYDKKEKKILYSFEGFDKNLARNIEETLLLIP